MNEIASPAPSPEPDRPKSRGRGHTVLFVALFLGFAGILAAGAFQALGLAPFHGGGCASIDPALVDKKIDRIAGWIVEDLGGTPEQEAKIAAIAKAAAKDLAPIHDELAAGHRKAAELLTATTVDRAALEAHRVKQMQLLDRATARLASAVADAAEALTPEQRAKAVEKLADHVGRHRHGFAN